MSEQVTAQEVPPTPGLRLVASLVRKLNIADYQNAVPALRELEIVNDGDSEWRNVAVIASSDPQFFQPKRWNIDAIGPRQASRISSLDLQLDGPLLARLVEGEHARVKFELRSQDASNVPLFTFEQDVELLPRNHWAGLSHLPEMIAAFVQPNDNAVDRLLKKAAQVLRDSGRNPALNGYESGPKHSWEILSAIWSAAAAARLDYSLPPASFEQTGQKVRSPEQVLEAGLATCLDLALLFAAAAEQAGLNPLIVFTSGHAFAGCWLRQEEFAVAVVDDPSALRKRLLLKELVLFETTAVVDTSVPTFSRACELGADQLAEDASPGFEAAVDIRRARMHKIKPIAAPSTVSHVPPSEPVVGQILQVAIEDAPELPEDIVPEPPEQDPRVLTPADRIKRWQRKLLDLSLRNSLLSFRKKKRAVTFDAPDPGKLEDMLATGKAFKILSRPKLMDGADARNRIIHESRTHEDLWRQHALDGLVRGEIFASSGDGELDSTLVDLYRSARTSLEEGGANTLFLALGFLIWTQDGKESQRHRAPLILIPVVLSRRSVRSGFTLTLHEDEPLFNPTLIEMLHQDFDLQIGITEGDLPKDDSGLDVKGIWTRLSAAIKDIKGWEVVPEVVLSTFSFAKHLMWKDLVHRTDQLRESPVVRHLIDTPREPYRSDIRFVDPKSLDRECDPREVFCPLPADSSQLAAILSASRGKDFVLIGPPGTGKSQTISNLIAHCVASGKRVLFVAEKIAALNVVYRRLNQQGLGQFCLEIHSSKARKSDVLAALGSAWSTRGNTDAVAWEAEAIRLKQLRDGLNMYVERLHQVRPNGMTVHRALSHVVSGESVPRVELPWPNPSSHDGALLEGFRTIIHKLQTFALAFGVGELPRTPLVPVGRRQWDPLWQADFLRSARQAEAAATQVRAAFEPLAKMVGLSQACRLVDSERQSLLELAGVIPGCVGTRWGFLVRSNASYALDELRSATECVREYRKASASLDEPWRANVVTACQKGIALLQELGSIRSALPSPWPTDLVEALRKGVELLQRTTEEEGRLSVRYDLTRVNASLLYAEWQSAEKRLWPLSSMDKKRVANSLAKAVVGGGQPEPANDLSVLVTLEAIRAEIMSIDLRVLPIGVWGGLQTSVEVAKAALRLQEGLSLVRDGKPWAPTDLGLIESGLCGPDLKQTLAWLKRLIAIEGEVSSLDWLRDATGNLWSGVCTNCEDLIAALEFCEDWRVGELRRSHAAVARGDCGDALRTQFEALHRLNELRRHVLQFAHLSSNTEGLWRGLDTDLGEVDRAFAFAAVLERTFPVIARATGEDAGIRAGIERLCRSAGAIQDVRDAADAFTLSCSALSPALATLIEVGSFSSQDAVHFTTMSVDEMRSTCERLAGAVHRLQRWCSWVQAREEARAAGLDGFIAGIEAGTIVPEDLQRAFDVNYCRWWLDHIVSGDDVLRTFISTEHEKRIADFWALDDRYTELTRDWIRAKLFMSTPSIESTAMNPEWGLLQRELTKKKRHLPLRELMARIPTVVTTLTPCLLMSPLSIAQYLTVSGAAFDVVVFDEASQITVWDAIGAIARAKQVVMVGDPKQLPPTNFFNRADEEPEESEDVPEDMESILDECIGASLPSLQLSWHYRSRHESLIAFSNRRYYGGKLITFPSPVTEDQAVNFHHVQGVYEKGGARTNQPEARAIVRSIVAHLRTPERAGHSIGVVTFNAEQQKLIEDLLDAERRSDPSLEAHFSHDSLEPVFVKNLESVQGDERDIMYFSVTYGPDIAGRLSMNFGPMNRDGGERRLNVAITRARRELRVFSSLRPEQIDLARTQATGVSELKYFLEFAERGPRAFAELVTRGTGEFESPFEQYVATSLQSRGWTVHTQIGVSDFRVDLGVVHPDAPGVYLAGIECDGATYHRSATARDRDKLREQVLRDLGWEIFRVWSTDWWIDRESTLNRLDCQLRKCLEQRPIDRHPAPENQTIHESQPDEDQKFEANQFDPELAVASAREGDQMPLAFSATDGCDASKFFEAAYDAELTRMVTAIVEREGPILDEVLARRIARLHGWHRTGTRITNRVRSIAARAFKQTIEETVGAFFWPQNLEAGQLIPFRPGLTRAVDEICMPELISLAQDVLSTGKTGEAVILAMAKAIGLQRLRVASRPRLESAIRLAQQQ